jgi:hypothetical protein
VDDGLDTVLEPPSLITGVDEVTTVPIDELASTPTADLGNEQVLNDPEPPLVNEPETASEPAPEPSLEPKQEITLAPLPADIADDATVRRSGHAARAPCPTNYIPSFSGKKYAMAQLPPVL